METRVITLSPSAFSKNDLSYAGELLREGKLVAFPTETVYGLGANALDGAACDAIFEAKGRPHDNPLIVHVLNPSDCNQYADTTSELFQKLSEKFMPGPLTVVLPKKSIIPDSVTVGLDTVALRCPAHPVARALLEVAGVPIAAPSANRSGKPSPTCASHVWEDMNGRIPLIVDGGASDVGLESTVVSIKGGAIHLLRPGFVTKEDLLTVTPKVFVSQAVLKALESSETPESPGMKYRHYAPKAPVSMVKGEDCQVRLFFQKALEEGNGVLCFDEDLPYLSNATNLPLISIGSKDDLVSQAQRLFSALRTFDSFSLKHIYARFTDQERLGLAVSNRLLRACAFQIIHL